MLVSPQPASRWPAICAEIRRLRRVEDSFIYEPVIVGSFEDAVCAAIVNPKILAVIVAEGFPFRSMHDAPALRRILDDTIGELSSDASALKLSRILKGVRPDLDVYVTTDREVEKLASDPAAASARRIFYAVEDLLELHLAIMEGIQERYETPFFDNLKRYAQRPVGTFHALPIARGKSVFKSEWIRDMGEFYGINLFLAESSATTGGLDSLLEPTGNIKKAQEMAARAFGADHVFFVTNGTSTSNKMVVQALVAPGDIVIVDRNCHKSHHYGLVLGGGQPLYVEAFPLTQFSMYGAVPLATIKKALLDLRDEGRLDRVRMLDLTNCTFDGHMYNTRRVMEECLAIKPDLIFLWDEAWSGFARWSPFLRPRTGMGAAAAIEEWMMDPASVAAYEKQQKELGTKPSRDKLMSTRLVPDPRQIRLRVYQTNSTHKSMSAIRQGSMVLVKDVDFGSVESQFHEAIFTHASTSPNQQLIASLDVARAPDGAGRLWPGDECHLDRPEDQVDHQLAPGDFQVLPGRWCQRPHSRCLPPVGLRRLPDAGHQLGGCRKVDAGGRILPRSDPHDPGLRHRRLRRNPTQRPAGQSLQHPGQQDLAQLGSAAVEHQQHPQRRGASGPCPGRNLRRDRRTAEERRGWRAQELCRPRQEPDA